MPKLLDDAAAFEARFPKRAAAAKPASAVSRLEGVPTTVGAARRKLRRRRKLLSIAANAAEANLKENR